MRFDTLHKHTLRSMQKLTVIAIKTPKPNARALNVPSSLCVHAPQAKKFSIKFPKKQQQNI